MNDLIRNYNARFDIGDVEESGVFDGHAAIFGELVPNYNEIVEKGAFTQTLKHNSGRVPVMYMHWDWVGMGTDAKQDDRGLFVSAKMAVEKSMLAKQAHGLMQLAAEVKRPAGLSIGFRIVKSKQDKDGVTRLTEVALVEYSVTPPGFQAAPNAGVANIRAAHASAIVAILKEMGYNTNALEPSPDAQQGAQDDEARLHSVSQTLDEVLRKLKRR